MNNHTTPDQTTTDLTEHLERGRAQLLEAMSAVSEDLTCCGWASDWARTLHAEGGIWETLGRAVGWPTGNYDAWVWMSWEEAAELYGHAAASAVRVPATDRAALREVPEFDGPRTVLHARVVREIIGRISGTGTGDSATEEVGAAQVLIVLREILADLERAAAAVLPELADRAAEWNAAADHLEAVNPDRGADFSDGVDWAVAELRRLAAEPAAAGPDQTGDETRAETVHACPPDGSGLTPCCGRAPFELPSTDRMTATGTVTCAPAVGGAQQQEED